MSAQVLATFIQISDLHLGDPDPAAAQPDAKVHSFWRHHGIFDGLFGHHYRALEALDRFVASMTGASLIVTGDLTATGSVSQYGLADDYLGAVWKTPAGGVVGLQFPGWLQRAIPGNHDHWPGRQWSFLNPFPFWGRPTAGLARFFPAVQSPSAAVALGGSGCWLRFLMIDTDADVRPFSHNRKNAIGAFQTQLQALAANLGSVHPKEIRVLLSHHSHEYQGNILAMEQASRQALEEFMIENEVAVLLTGHVHTPHVDPVVIHHPTQQLKRKVLEARCGTTLQRDSIPATWTDWRGRRPAHLGLHPNTLLVHRLVWHINAIWWETEAYRRIAAGFVLPSGWNALPKKWKIKARHKVWPWP